MLMIKVAKIQGEIHFLPEGEVAISLARRLGTTSLSAAAVAEAACDLDTEVVIVEGKCVEAAELLAAYLQPVTLH